MQQGGYIILGLLGVAILYLLFGGNKAQAANAPSSNGSNLVDPNNTTSSLSEQVDELLNDGGLSSAPSKKECKDACKQLCQAVPELKGRAQKAGWQRGRRSCKNQCESDCATGQNVRSTYPNAWRS